ncbi:MAG: hypothetical protein M1470_00750 [Bacteroidetes bacterium]|nr:hypothetical protein [Bacteroidota bacterium]MCL5737407.1 hypothetical protein [Bacteroidota bacterium]
MRRYSFLLLLFFALVFSNKSFAQNSGIGAGIIVGGPTGLSAKFWTSNLNAVDLGIGWSTGGELGREYNGWFYYHPENYLHLHADYLWQNFNAIKSTERLPIYYGLGFHLDSGSGFNTAFGVRGVFGIDWMPHATPLDVFLEFAPVLYLTPSTEMGLDAGFGARYFFH